MRTFLRRPTIVFWLIYGVQKEGFVEFVVSKIQIRIRKPIRKRDTSHLYHVYLGVYPICLLALGTRDKSDTPQIDVIQIEHVHLYVQMSPCYVALHYSIYMYIHTCTYIIDVILVSVCSTTSIILCIKDMFRVI